MPVMAKQILLEYTEDYLRQKGINTRKAFRCLNPLHEDKHPSMSFNKDAGNVHCFSCGVSYDIIDLIGMDYSLHTFPEKYAKACDIFGLQKPDIKTVASNYNTYEKKIITESKALEYEKITAVDENRNSDFMQILTTGEAPEYLYSRGITEESCAKHNFFQKDGKVYFPIFKENTCTGWCARLIDDKSSLRYINSKGKLDIFNGDNINDACEEIIYITEGIIDAVCLEQLGNRAVALCGSQNVKKLILICEKFKGLKSLKFVLCGDEDSAGQSMNESLLKALTELGFSCEIFNMSYGDINNWYLKDRKSLEDALKLTFTEKKESELLYNNLNVKSAINSFFEYAACRALKGAIPTGFVEMDKILDGGFHTGLYVVGAISSLGKTSFALQIADYIASKNMDVIFFSLEQSCFELMAKSMSRISAEMDSKERKNAFTLRQLLSGEPAGNFYREQLLERVKNKYAMDTECLFLKEGFADIGTQEIRNTVIEHIKLRKKSPVVIVDYLQILKPHEARATDKQNTDRSVVELKRISRDFDVPVIALSSFNRENYKLSVSMEAFKESGAVEYSSDVLFGMQLKGAGQKGFDVNLAKSAAIRDIELVMLKNRSGMPYARINFKYNAKYSFMENK